MTEAAQNNEGDEGGPDPELILTQSLGFCTGHARGKGCGVPVMTTKEFLNGGKKNKSVDSEDVISLQAKIAELEKLREEEALARMEMQKRIDENESARASLEDKVNFLMSLQGLNRGS